MAEIDLSGKNKNSDLTQNVSEQMIEEDSVTSNERKVSTGIVTNQSSQMINTDVSISGKQNLYEDPNRINVTIVNKDIPLVILFGPAACGKTMTLVRLTRYLRSKSFKIFPIRTFRPSDDQNYQKLCDNFDSMIN